MKSKNYYFKTILLTLGMIAFFFILPSQKVLAEDGWGSLGNNIDWYFHEDSGLLEFTGKGDMPANKFPWSDFKSQITEITFEDGITSISSRAFSDYKALKKVSIPSTVKSIGSSAFSNTGLTSVTIPNGAETIGYKAFCYCSSLKTAKIASSVKTIDYYAFAYCENLTSVTLNKGLEKINYWGFAETGIKKITIPSTVTHIGDNTFTQCDSLTSITFPSSITSSGSYVCYDCDSLRYATFNGNCVLNNSSFESCDKLQALKLGPNVKGIGYRALGTNKSLTAVFVPESVLTIDKTAVADSTDMTFYGYKNTAAYDFAGTSSTVSFVNAGTASGMNKWNAAWQKATATKLTSSNTKVTLSKTTYTYDGSSHKPSVTVKYGSKTLARGTDYSVSYATGRTKVGKYSVKIKFQGKYTGTITKYFKINPQKTYITSYSRGKTYIKLNLKKRSTQTTGYQVRYSKKKDFSSYITKTITSYKTTSKKLTGLTSNKGYYIKVRTYKTVNGTKYYSGWSTAKLVKTK